MSLTVPEFLKPYTNGYVDGESGDTPVTAAILNTNYDAYLLALNTFLDALNTSVDGKQDAESGKGLSENDYTDEDKQKLAGIDAGATAVEANPSGTSSTNLTKISIGGSIYMIPSGGSGGSTVVWNQIQLTGTKIAEITIDGIQVDVYAPSGGSGGSSVSWTQVLGSGTKIGTITIDGTDTDVYAPTPIDVEANPSDSATAGDLTKLKVGNSIYSIPSGGSGGASDLSDLGDVTITNVQNGQILKYNSTTSKWENVNDTGGGGGHTILDNSGTSMTQRTNLQFKGAYVKDDSTNSKTEVDILRHTTSAEFDQMTTDEKQGILVLDDEYDFDGLYMVNGVFIDTDNVIVQETEFTTSASYTATQDCIVQYRLIGIANSGCESNIDGVTYAHHISDYGHAMYTECAYLKKGQTITFDSRSYSTWASWYRVFGIQTSDDVPDPNYHVYSTDEKVVGEWIDGSTLYEKTFDLGTDLLVSTSSWTTLGITLDADKIIETKTTSTSGSFQGNILIYNDNGTWKGQTPRNGNDSSYVHYLTITYTKS